MGFGMLRRWWRRVVASIARHAPTVAQNNIDALGRGYVDSLAASWRQRCIPLLVAVFVIGAWLIVPSPVAAQTPDSTSTLVPADEGKAVSVVVGFTDDGGNHESRISPQTTVVSAVPPSISPSEPQNLELTPVAVGTNGVGIKVSWDAPSATGGSDISGYRIQWKGGNQDYPDEQETRQAFAEYAPYTIDTTSPTPVEGDELTVRVAAVNGAGVGVWTEKVGWLPSHTDLQLWLLMKEYADEKQTTFPWVLETWNYLDRNEVPVEVDQHRDLEASLFFRAIARIPIGDDGLKECHVEKIKILQIEDPEPRIIIHEMAHAYSLANRVTDAPGPLAIAHLYFVSLNLQGGIRGCAPYELYADVLTMLTLDIDKSSYWKTCNGDNAQREAEALDVLRSAANGEMPQWFDDTYTDSDGEPDLESLWTDVQDLPGREWNLVIYQLRNAFGGYCNNRATRMSAQYIDETLRQPWMDGGCPPPESSSLEVTPGNGELTLAWDAPASDGDSDVDGYIVQWRSGFQSYYGSTAQPRRAVLDSPSRLTYSISGLTNGVEYDVRVRAYNHIGPGQPLDVESVTPSAAETPDGSPDATHVATCSNGTVVPETTETDLINDCAWLLQVKDELAGTATLNWSGSTAITSWTGVTVRLVVDTTVSPATLSKHVTQLVLSGEGLTGTIPAELGNLSNLKFLYLQHLQLTGTIPAELSNLSTLERLLLNHNQLTGTIPVELGGLANLESINLRNNQLTGTIPAELGNLSALETLQLQENMLSGSIPVELGGLANLEFIDLRNNQLTGTIPAELGSLSNLTVLSLQENLLTGSIPTQLGGLSKLLDMNLSANRLTGSIPMELGSLSSLVDLNLQMQKNEDGEYGLTGSIPMQLGNLSNLRTLYLAGNKLSGSIPAQLGNVSNLQTLYLHDNQLTGSIPMQLGSLSNLTDLRLDKNQLSGSIPTQFGNLTSLRYLYLHLNRLSGSIPAELGSLSRLDWLYLHENQLTGTIPSELGNLYNLSILALSINNLSGRIPAELGNLYLDTVALSQNPLLTGCIPAGLRRARLNDLDSVGLPFCDVQLSGLSISPGTLSPAFDADVTDYTATASGAQITLTATNDHRARIQFLDSNDATLPDASGWPGHQVNLPTGETVIQMKLTSADFQTEHRYTLTVTRLNAQPVFPASETGARSVLENTTDVVVVGAPVAAMDADGDTLIYTITGAEAASFDVDSSSGQLLTKTGVTYDRETKASYSFTLFVHDGLDDVGGASTAIDDSITVTVTITDVNEPPVVTGGPTSVNDYAENGTREVGRYRADDPENVTLTWSLAGADADRFDLDTSSVPTVLTFETPPDYESPADNGRNNEYQVIVQASDGTHTGQRAVTVTVTDVNENPVVSGPTSVTYRENDTREIGRYRADDPENATLSWSVGPPQSNLSIVTEGADAVVRFNAPPDFEALRSSGSVNQVVVVTASDGPNAYVLAVALTIENVEEPGTVSFSAQPQVTTALRATLTDPDERVSGLAWTWERSTNRSTWTPINGADTAVYTPVLDDLGYYLRATAGYVDGEGPNKTAQSDPTDRVQAEPGTNIAPSFPSSETGQRQVAEGTRASVAIGPPVAADDQDNDALTYTLSGADEASFDLDEDSGQLLTKAVLDRETKASYSVMVTATDPSIASAQIVVAITVTDVNEGPVAGNDTATTAEDTATVIDVLSNDEDPEKQSLTVVSLTRPANGTATVAADQTITYTPSPDFHGVDSFSYRASDGEHRSAAATVQVTVTSVNDPPEVRGSNALDVRENSTGSVARYTATDPERDVFEWSVIGADGRFFSIDSMGVLTFQNPPNYEARADADGDNIYEVTIAATDAEGDAGELHARVTVRDVDEAPEVSGQQSLSFSENQTTARVLATYSATDPEDPTATITRWSLTGSDAGDFTITENGELTFRQVPDYDRPADSGRDNVYNFSVRASDGRHYGYFPVTVIVTDVNEPPTITTISTSATELRQRREPDRPAVHLPGDGSGGWHHHVDGGRRGREVLRHRRTGRVRLPCDQPAQLRATGGLGRGQRL